MENDKQVVVAGGGAAGMMAAIAAAGEGAHVVLLEKTSRLGLKLQISGGGRCNVTNDESDPRRLVRMYPGGGQYLLNAFHAYGKEDLLDLLRRRGVETVIEPPYGKVFPASDKSTDILEALQAEMRDLGVDVRLNARVSGVDVQDGRVVAARTESYGFPCRAAILCVGGKSMPKSGSSGDGYTIARAVGHTVTDLFPSLVPLKVEGVGGLAGIALRDVEGIVLVDGKKADGPFRGDMLFTHSGLSGPVILQLSRAACEALRRGATAEIRIAVRPGATADAIDSDLRQRFAARSAAQLATVISELMPKAAAALFLSNAGVAADRPVSQLTRDERRRLVEGLLSWRFAVTGWLSFDIAEVTAGGVDLKEVDPKTFESRIVKGLFWAGEVLDVDGYVGGYNLQAAWSTGWVAGKGAARAALAEGP